MNGPTLGATIRQRRRDLGLSQEQLADRVAELGDAAFRQADVSRIEQGRVGLPRRERLGALARALGMPVGELLARSGWAGADGLLDPASPRTVDPPPPPLPPPSAPARTPRHDAPAFGSSRLRDAIEQARAVREDSVRVLEHARLFQARRPAHLQAGDPSPNRRDDWAGMARRRDQERGMDQEYLGRSGDLGGYRIEVGEDRVRVLKDGVVVLDHAVPPHGERSIGAFVAGAAELRLAWGRLPDGDEMIAISDAAAAAEGAPSYVVNITDEDLSGWGHGGGLLGSPDASDA